MYARVTTIHVKEDKVEEAVQLYKESVLPAAKKQKGFRGVLLLTDAATGRGMSITLWDTEKEASVNEQNLYYQNQLVKVLPYFSNPPVREGFDVNLFVKKK